MHDLGVDVEAHGGEQCHTVVVKARFDGTVVEIPVCTEPRRHRGRKPDSELVVVPTQPSEADLTGATERRERRRATEARIDWLTERLTTGRRIATADAFALTIKTWIDAVPYAAVQRAAKLLGVDSPADGYVDYAGLLHGHLADDPKRDTAVAVALIAAIAEDRARQSLTTATVARYIDAIERLGYQPTDWEHTQRLRTAA